MPETNKPAYSTRRVLTQSKRIEDLREYTSFLLGTCQEQLTQIAPEEAENLNPKFLAALKELYFSCKSFVSSYEYLSKAELYKCKTLEELQARIEELK